MDKAANAEMLGTHDGVMVIEEGNGFQVKFDFSNTLVKKIGTVQGKEFVRDEGVWNIPASSRAALADVVADMRDFNRNNGVQVKDLADGGKEVLFDYDGDMARIIGGVAGAAFDKNSYTWKVAKDSKALTGKDGFDAGYLETAINQMRKISIDVAKDHEAILERAVAAAEELGVRAAIVYPDKDHSYTGEILNANGHFAAQLTGRDDAKEAGFIAIHKLADLGKTVFKGDNLRIDYVPNRDVKIRTTAVYLEQQKERANLKDLAESKIDGADVLNASQKDGAVHQGEVIAVGSHFVLQSVGRQNFVIHGLDNLKSREIAKGQNLEISYKNRQGAVVDLAQKKTERSQGQAR